jgi:hypothetical protein
MLMQVIEETICEQSENSKFGTGFGTWSFRTLDLVRNFGGRERSIPPVYRPVFPGVPVII